MNIVVASGKGGTGKTTVATNLSSIISRSGNSAVYCDCDVEAPNGHLFLRPVISKKEIFYTSTPIVAEAKCNLCGDCSKICQFSAIVVIGKKVLTYPELCHACMGCSLVCSEKAITRISRSIGKIYIGRTGVLRFISGELAVGEASAVPLIRQVKSLIDTEEVSVIDSPPGTSCPMIETINGADHVLLVTEPTPFGLNDLKIAVETVRKFNIPFSVVINRSDIGDNRVVQYCDSQNIDVMAEIGFSREIAYAYSHGILAIDVSKEMEALYKNLFVGIQATINSDSKVRNEHGQNNSNS